MWISNTYYKCLSFLISELPTFASRISVSMFLIWIFHIKLSLPVIQQWISVCLNNHNSNTRLSYAQIGDYQIFISTLDFLMFKEGLSAVHAQHQSFLCSNKVLISTSGFPIFKERIIHYLSSTSDFLIFNLQIICFAN